MSLAQALRAMSLFADGNRYVNEITEFSPPKIALQTEDYRGGGMDAPIEMETGMEKLEGSFKVSRFDKDLLRHFGLAPGKQITISVRGAYQDDGKVIPVVHNMTGTWKEIDPGTAKSGSLAEISISISIKRYTLTIDGKEAIHVDIEALTRRINGEDVLSDIARIIG